MAAPPHLSELELVSLIDDELAHDAKAAALSHLVRCFPCNRAYEALRRESDVLRAAVAPAAAPRREDRRELGWVVAAGLLVSFGLTVVRRALVSVGEMTSETPLPDALPLLSSLGYRLLSLLDFQRVAVQIAYGGIVFMTLIGIALVSATRRSRAGAAPLLLTAALLSPFATPAEAWEVRSGSDQDCRVTREQVVNDDLVLLCDQARIEGAVEGDVFFLGRTVTVSGRVEGDLIGAANELVVDGSVGLAVRSLAQIVRIGGTVGRSLTAAGERISVLPGGRVEGGVTAAGSLISVQGPVGRSVVAAGETLEVDAPVGGDLRIRGKTLRMGSEASVAGTASFHGASEPEREPGAAEVSWSQPEPEEADPWGAARGVVLRFGMGFLLGLALVLLAAGPIGAIAAIGGRPVGPLVLGLLLFVGVPFAAVLLAITFVGLPLALATAALYGFLLYAARVAAAMVIGQAILGLASTTWQRVGRLALGLAILAFAVEIPVAGVAVSLLTMFLGLGTFGVWVWRSRPGAAA